MQRFLAILFLIPVLGAPTAAEDLPEPTKKPAVLSDSEKQEVREAVGLHDAGNYDGAIAKLKEVLSENPDAVVALHELAFSCFAAKNYGCALEAARKGAEYQSQELPMFYTMIANVHDDTGGAAEAQEVFKTSIGRFPDFEMLRFNYALSLMRSNDMKLARDQLERSVQLNPNHASSHVLLGRLYESTGYKIPAIFALSRFLVLEPDSPRTAGAIQVLQKLLVGDVTPGRKPGDLNITLPSNAKQDEGDFLAVEMAIAMGVAASTTEKGKQRSAFEHLVATYSVAGDVIESAHADKKGFAAMYYGPYFRDLSKQKLTEAFVAYAWRDAALSGAAEWASQNQDKVKQFVDWSAHYPWSGGK